MTSSISVDDLRKRLFSPSPPHPAELRRAFSALATAASRAAFDASTADLIVDCLSHPNNSIADRAIEVLETIVDRAGGNNASNKGFKQQLDHLVALTVERVPALASDAAVGSAVRLVTTALLAAANNNIESCYYSAKGHPYSAIATLNRSAIPAIERDILERVLVAKQFQRLVEPYLVLLLSNPLIGSDTAAQLTISSVCSRLLVEDVASSAPFLSKTVLNSPLTPPAILLATVRALVRRPESRLSVLARLADTDSNSSTSAPELLSALVGSSSSTADPLIDSVARKALEFAVCCAVFASTGLSGTAALSALSSLLDLLEILPRENGPILASLLVATLVRYTWERESDPERAKKLKAMIRKAEEIKEGSGKGSGDTLADGVEALRKSHPEELSSPALSLWTADLVSLLRFTNTNTNTPYLSHPFSTDTLIIAHPTTLSLLPPSPTRLPIHLHLLSTPQTPSQALSALLSLPRLSSTSSTQAYPTSRAVRASLAIPDPALKLRMLGVCAEGNGRVWRWWIAELGNWASLKVGRKEDRERRRVEREVERAKWEEEEEAVMLCVSTALATHPRSLAQPLFPILLALLHSDLLQSHKANEAAISAICTALRLGISDPRVVWNVVFKRLLEGAGEGMNKGEMVEFWGVCGECWDETEAYTLFLTDEIIPFLAPLALSPTKSQHTAAAQASLALFPPVLINPLLPPEITELLPLVSHPSLLSCLITSEATTMRRSLLRGSGSTGRERAEAPPSLIEAARSALSVIEGLAEKPLRAGAKPGYVLGTLLGSTQGQVPSGVSPLVFLQKREKVLGDAVKDVTAILLSDQPVLARLGLIEGFEKGWTGLWGAVVRVLDTQIASGRDVSGISVRELAEKWYTELTGKVKDPKSPLEATNSLAACVGLCLSLVRSGEMDLGQRYGRALLASLLAPGRHTADEGNDEVDAGRSIAIATLTPVMLDRTDAKGWGDAVGELKRATETEGTWTKWAGAVGLGLLIKTVPKNLPAVLDTALQALLAVSDTETGKGLGLALSATVIKDTDPQLFDELIESALVTLETFSTRKPMGKISEFSGSDGSAYYVGWSASLIPLGEQRTRARSVLVKTLESVNEKKDLILHTQMAIAVSHFFANDTESSKEHGARLSSIAASASPSLSSIVSVPSLLGHDILSGQLSTTATPSSSDTAAATKLLAKLASIAGTSAELRLARMSAVVCGKLCGATLEEDVGPTLLGGKKEPSDLSRLEKETSVIRAVFDALKSGKDTTMLVEALEQIEVALPAVDWAPLLSKIWDQGDLVMKSRVLSFTSRHCVVSSSRSLLDFLVSRCEPRYWGSLGKDLQLRILGDAGIGKLLDIAGLEPFEPDPLEPGAADDAPKMTIAPTKLLSLVGESFEEALSKDDHAALQFTLLTTLHSRMAEHRTVATSSQLGEIPVAAQLASLLCRVFPTLPLPTDPTSVRMLRLCTESIACDARVFGYFIGGDADGDPSRDVVKVCVAWELDAAGKAKADFGMTTATLASTVLENEFSAMEPGEGRRARMFSVLQALAVQLAVDEVAEIKNMLAGKEARLSKGLRTVLARRAVVLRWLGRLLDTGIVVGSATPEELTEFMCLVCGGFVEMCLGGKWWMTSDSLRDQTPEQEAEAEQAATTAFEFEPELAEEGDGLLLAARFGQLLASFLSSTLSTDAKAFPEIAPQQTACSQVLRRLLRIRGISGGVLAAGSEVTAVDRAVVAALNRTLTGDRTLVTALNAAERDAWSELV